jgi:NADPH-dependent ferric siderophore reductase
MASRPPPRPVEVLGKQQITPNMLRLTLSGSGLAGFPADSEGGYIKLRLFPNGRDAGPVVRTYTIRQQRADAIDVDFALHADAHGHCGPATAWARDVAVGDMIEIGGPGPAKPLPSMQKFYAVAGDMTALPAISVNLHNLAEDAQGYVAIEVQSAEDVQQLNCPKGVAIDWIVNSSIGEQPHLLAEKMRTALAEVSDFYGWCACEFGAMQQLRDYLRGEKQLTPDGLYISSYWKLGLIEDDHKRVKRQDAEATL